MSTRERAAWAVKINAAWRKSVEGILECASHLRDARAGLGIDEFKKMIEHELVVGERTVERLLNIAADKRLATHVSVLPASWGTLYALARVPDPIFAEAIADGRINPGMTRAEAKELMPRLKPHPKSETVAVLVARPPDETDEPPRFVQVRILEPEQAYRPDQTPPTEPEHQRERAVADGLAELATLIGSCDVEALAALLRDKRELLQHAQRVARFMERLRLALGGANGALH
jgi:hypothetical protein